MLSYQIAFEIGFSKNNCNCMQYESIIKSSLNYSHVSFSIQISNIKQISYFIDFTNTSVVYLKIASRAHKHTDTHSYTNK